jgi:hypothetical protein
VRSWAGVAFVLHDDTTLAKEQQQKWRSDLGTHCICTSGVLIQLQHKKWNIVTGFILPGKASAKKTPCKS